MKLKKLGTALVVVLALGAVMVSSASAAAVTEDATWRTGAAGTVLTTVESVNTTGSGELVTEVGSTKLVLKATGLECLSCTVQNTGGTAVGAGKLKFTGVTVVTPAPCAVAGGSVTTTALNLKADYMGVAGPTASNNAALFVPVEGTRFATVELVKGTGACALAGSYPVTGSQYVSTNKKHRSVRSVARLQHQRYVQ